MPEHRAVSFWIDCYVLHRLFLTLLLLGAVPSRALAAWAEVAELTAADAQGRWRPVATTTQVSVLRGDQRLPATRGMALQEGDRIVTDDARARVVLGRGEALTIAEHTDVEVRARTALQRLGQVYYTLQSTFVVQYGTVQTAVDGTEFVVDGDGATVTVTVIEGHVRVSTSGGQARLGRWDSVATSAGEGASGEAPPSAPDPAARPVLAARLVEQAFGPPRVELGFVAGVGLDNGGAAAQLRLSGRVRVAGALRLTLDTGLGSNGPNEGLRLPQGLGLELGVGPLAFGAQTVATFELARLGCNGSYTAVHIGGVGSVRGALPLSRRVSIQAVLRGGYVQRPLADLGIGLAVAL